MTRVKGTAASGTGQSGPAACSGCALCVKTQFAGQRRRVVGAKKNGRTGSEKIVYPCVDKILCAVTLAS